jgi:hypothetical protein
LEETKMTAAAKKLEVINGGSNASTAAKLALVKSPKDEGERVMLDVEALDPSLQSQVRKFYHEVNVSLAEFGRAGLKVGKVLHEARAVLKPLGIWIAFLNRIPGLSAKTGDRFIKRYEMAHKQLSETILGIAITTGIDLAGEDEKQPFGKYTRAVKKVGNPPRDTGDQDKDTEKARVWLAKVLVKYSAEVKRRREQAAEVDPTEKVSDILVRAMENYVEDKAGQIGFLKRVLKTTLRRLGYSDLIVTSSEQRRGAKEKVVA